MTQGLFSKPSHYIKAQKQINHLQNLYKKTITEKIVKPRENYEGNSAEIRKLERELGKIQDGELRDKLQDLKIFEILNAEKSSPHFLDLTKKTSSCEKLSDICDNEVNLILSAEDLNNYITNFYSSLYRCDSAVQGEIEDFLGQEICQHPMVRDSILTQEEKINLDKELEIVELDNALEHASGKSAPGVDGFTYRFIRKFWHIYRQPIFTCAMCKYSTGKSNPS